MTALGWVAFLAAAGVGAAGRYALDGWVGERTSGELPWGTFVVNVSGCFVLGVLTGLGLYHGSSGSVRTIVGTGGLGAYTTFSTFTFETVRLAEEGLTTEALGNAAGGFVVGLGAAAVGLALTLL